MIRFERCKADVERMATGTHQEYCGDPLKREMYLSVGWENRYRDLLAAIEREHPDSIILKQIDGWLDYVEAKERAA